MTRSILKGLFGARSRTRALTAAARLAQSEARFRDAAALYVEALRLRPGRAPIHVQAGHMFKEAGEFDLAEEQYLEAAALTPNDADLALQLGHFHKTVGRLNDAWAAYQRAADLAPDWNEPTAQLEAMSHAGWRPKALFAAVPVRNPFALDPLDAGDEQSRAGATLDFTQIASAYTAMAPERLPRPFHELLGRTEPSTTVAQFGVIMNSYWGPKRVARGLEAIRGFCIETMPMRTVTALVNGLVMGRETLRGPFELEYEVDRDRVHKYVFNLWLDFSPFAPGRYSLELRFNDGYSAVHTHHEDFVVEPPLLEADHPDSDALLTLDPADDRPIEEQVRARPSVVHDAVSTALPARPRNILVLRTDQLGDMVASVPALLRLRELFPEARVVGLLGPANVDLAHSIAGLFDEVISVDFRESMTQRTRTLSWEDQNALRERLAAYRFDLAIDLATSVMSRPLLALTGAPFLYGFDDPAWPRLTASVNDAWHDPKSGREITPHATRVLSLIERLPLLFASNATVVRRQDLPRDRLAAFAIAEGDRYAVIHTGARIVFSRWGHYPALAERLHRETDLKIVVFGDSADWSQALAPDIAASDRITVIDRQLPFDDFDALLSYCALYVGNDSGPKHLAALRGVPVVSIHSARTGWREWGQEQTGLIISRKVPCAGCSIYHDVDECGKDFTCMTAISLDEVYTAVRRYV